MQPSAAPEGPDIARHRLAYESIAADASSLLAGLTNSQFNWRPAPGRWSIAECLAHLDAAVRLYLPEIDRAIDLGWSAGLRHTGGSYEYGRLEWGWARSLEPPPRRRYPAPRSMAPSASSVPIEPGARSFADTCRAMAERLDRTDGLDLKRVKVRIPMFKLLRVSLGVVFELHGAHSRRHLWQARQVRSDRDFPAAMAEAASSS